MLINDMEHIGTYFQLWEKKLTWDNVFSPQTSSIKWDLDGNISPIEFGKKKKYIYIH